MLREVNKRLFAIAIPLGVLLPRLLHEGKLLGVIIIDLNLLSDVMATWWALIIVATVVGYLVEVFDLGRRGPFQHLGKLFHFILR